MLPAFLTRLASPALRTVAAAALVGCAATTIPPVPPEPTPLVSTSTVPLPRPALMPGQRELAGADGISRLCETLRDEDGMTFEGDEVQQARAREEHEHQRTQAAEGSYVVLVPAAGFGFRGYDLGAKRLALDTARGFAVADGIAVLPSDPSTSFAFAEAPDAAERILRSHDAGALTLRLVFRPVRSELRKDGCVRQSGGRVLKVPADLLAYALLGANGAAVAHGHVPEYSDDTPVVAPAVVLGRPRSSEGREVPAPLVTALQELAPALLPCYQKSLEAHPALRGTLVLDLRLTSDGHIEGPTMQVSSLGDDHLVACVLARAARTKLSSASPAHVSVPLTFDGAGG